MPRHRRIIPHHIALGNFYGAGACRGMSKPCHGMNLNFLYFQLIWSYFIFSLIFLLKYHLQDKITCKNSQNGDKQDKNTKYKRVKIYV